MPPKVVQTAEEVQAEIDADPIKLIHNPVKTQPHKGVNKDLGLSTEKPELGSWFSDPPVEV